MSDGTNQKEQKRRVPALQKTVEQKRLDSRKKRVETNASRAERERLEFEFECEKEIAAVEKRAEELSADLQVLQRSQRRGPNTVRKSGARPRRSSRVREIELRREQIATPEVRRVQSAKDSDLSKSSVLPAEVHVLQEELQEFHHMETVFNQVLPILHPLLPALHPHFEHLQNRLLQMQTLLQNQQLQQFHQLFPALQHYTQALQQVVVFHLMLLQSAPAAAAPG